MNWPVSPSLLNALIDSSSNNNNYCYDDIHKHSYKHRWTHYNNQTGHYNSND